MSNENGAVDEMVERDRGTETRPNVHELMGRVLADIGYVDKGGFNEAQGYKFRGIDQFMDALHPVMAKHGVFLVPEVVDRETFIRPRFDRQGKEVGVTTHQMLTVAFHFYGPNGDRVTATTLGEASDTADKAGNKAMSAALKYAIMQTFLVPTQELSDGDNDTPDMGTIPRQSRRSEPDPTPEPTAEKTPRERMLEAGWEESMLSPEMVENATLALAWRKDLKAAMPAECDKIDAEAKRNGAKALASPEMFRAIVSAMKSITDAWAAEAQERLDGLVATNDKVDAATWADVCKRHGFPDEWAAYAPSQMVECRKVFESLATEQF